MSNFFLIITVLKKQTKKKNIPKRNVDQGHFESFPKTEPSYKDSV